MSLAPQKIAENIYQFNEPNEMGPYVDSYLIIGSQRAMVVDTLQKLPGLYAAVRALTDLPIDVAITHGHLDHAGVSTKEFAEAGCRICMNMADFDLLCGMVDYSPKREWFTHLENGHIFDLGGMKFEAIYCPGHTKGSLVLLDSGHELLFSGDTIGSGHFWMQVPGAVPLNMYQMNLQAVYDRTKPLQNLLVYPGHRNQSPVQLTGQYVKDTLTITKRLVAGVWEGEDAVLDFHGRHMEYKHIGYGQMVDYCYDPENVRGPRPTPEISAVKEQFTAEIFKKDGRYMDYMFFTPTLEEGEKYPLVIYLHGAGERGNDLRRSLANPGATSFAAPDWQKEHPCFVMAPQCADNAWWTEESYLSMLAAAALTLPANHPIDANRIYITGLSMGGMGTWAMIARYPRLFAAAMPICGAGDPFAVKAAKDVPVWAFHAVNDPVVPVTGKIENPLFPACCGTRMLVAALRSTGNKNVRLTEYSAAYMDSLGLHGHASWVPAYDDQQAKEWLFSFTREGRYDIQTVAPGVWNIDDFNNDSMYLVEGTEKALLIDTGLGKGDILGMIRSLTSLPVELGVTHAHYDHMYHVDQFDRFYMSEKDKALLDEPFMKAMMDGKTADFTVMTAVKDGDVIDLGGGIEIEVFDLAGHTPGSVCFVDKKRGICFCGDALGVWMQVPCATDLSVYRDNLISFKKRMTEKGYQDFTFLGGHRIQEGGAFPFGDDYKPNCMERVDDLIELCGLILNEDIDYVPFTMGSFAEPAFVAVKGLGTIVFTMSNRK